jgi:hypothetical protein
MPPLWGKRQHFSSLEDSEEYCNRWFHLSCRRRKSDRRPPSHSIGRCLTQALRVAKPVMCDTYASRPPYLMNRALTPGRVARTAPIPTIRLAENGQKEPGRRVDDHAGSRVVAYLHKRERVADHTYKKSEIRAPQLPCAVRCRRHRQQHPLSRFTVQAIVAPCAAYTPPIVDKPKRT